MKREDITALGIEDKDVLDKIMALHGADIERHKNNVTTLTIERDGLKEQLGEANGKLAGYDPEWKTKAEQAETAAQTKIAEMQYAFAAQQAAGALEFTSESARKAFLSELVAKKLPLQEDKLLGLDDYVKAYKETDPGAFANGDTPPAFASRTPGVTAGTLTDKDKANAAFREAFGRKGE